MAREQAMGRRQAGPHASLATKMHDDRSGAATSYVIPPFIHSDEIVVSYRSVRGVRSGRRGTRGIAHAAR